MPHSRWFAYNARYGRYPSPNSQRLSITTSTNIEVKTHPQERGDRNFGEIPVNVFQRNPTNGIGDIVLRDVQAQLYYQEKEGEMLSLPDLLWICAKNKDVQIGGWNGFMQSTTEEMLYTQSFISFLPFVDLPAHDYDCIHTRLYNMLVGKVDRKLLSSHLTYRYTSKQKTWFTICL